ncbi:MAG: hypothetical protein ACYCX4_04095 [Bacillota bacterium]
MALNPKQTTGRVAKKAGKRLNVDDFPKDIKSIIASDLAQAKLKEKKKLKKK